MNISFSSLCLISFQSSPKNSIKPEQKSLYCGSLCFLLLLCTRYESLQCFSSYFGKIKEIEALQPIFPDYIISFDYFLTKEALHLVLKKVYDHKNDQQLINYNVVLTREISLNYVFKFR